MSGICGYLRTRVTPPALAPILPSTEVSRFRSVLIWLLALSATLLMALPGGALDTGRYFCRMAERVVDECCCPGHPKAGCEDTVAATDCCERIGVQSSSNLARTALSFDGIPPAVLTAVIADPVRRAPRSRLEPTPVAVGRGPPATDQLFLVHCALLI